MTAIREVQVRTLGELIEAVMPQRPDPESGRFRERAVYRGVGFTDYSLLTSLDRIGMPATPPHAKCHLEEHLLRNFLRYSRPHLGPGPVNEWELLIVAQHHGLPTRLLDWSHSPLTAAHFATIRDDPAADRVIWKLDWGRMHDRFGLPPLALLVGDLDRALAEKGIGSLWQLFGGPDGLREHFVCMLEPPALDARIVAQSAAFTLSTDKTRPIDAILAGADLLDCLTRFIIPGSCAGRIRDQLDICGIDEGTLFPGLDSVAAEIRRYYAVTGDPDAQGGPTDQPAA